MTPRKYKTRHKSAQSVHQPSDNEIDLNTPLDIPPPPPSRTTNELNLSVLLRHNPEVESILSIAPYAVIYAFPASTQQWEKSGVEGTLFICQLTAVEANVERYVVMVLNRRGLENFTAELLNGDDVEITQEYVILRVGNQGEHSIYGIWIFSEPPPSSTANTRDLNAQIIEECAVQAETSRKLAAERSKSKAKQEEVAAPVKEVVAVDQGRRISVRELFGARNEHSGKDDMTSISLKTPSRQFTPSADTQFFRSAIRPSQTHK